MPGGDRLYVPADQMDRVGVRGADGPPTVHRLGGADCTEPEEGKEGRPGDGGELLQVYAAQGAGRLQYRPALAGWWSRRSRSAKPVTRNAPSPMSSPTWRYPSRWTGSSAATWASARPRSPTGGVQGGAGGQAGRRPLPHNRARAAV